MYLCTHLSVQVASPTLSCGSLYIATHLRKHCSVILRQYAGGMRAAGSVSVGRSSLVEHVCHGFEFLLLGSLHDPRVPAHETWHIARVLLRGCWLR